MAEKGVDTKEGPGKSDAPLKKFPLKIMLLAVVFLSLSAGGFFVWKGNLLAGLLAKDEKGEAVLEKDGKSVLQDIGPIYPLEIFIVNLADAHAKRYLKSKLELELSTETALPEMERRLPQIRDRVLTLLSSKSYDEINSLEGKFQLRAEIMSALNQHLKTGQITNIYFTEFIVQ